MASEGWMVSIAVPELMAIQLLVILTLLAMVRLAALNRENAQKRHVTYRHLDQFFREFVEPDLRFGGH